MLGTLARATLSPIARDGLCIVTFFVMRSLQHRRLLGHGQALLTFLYGLARSRESVFEITVEDPAPGFEKVGCLRWNRA